MKIHALIVSTLLSLALTQAAFAQDVNKLMEAVDTDKAVESVDQDKMKDCLLYTSPSPRDA